MHKVKCINAYCISMLSYHLRIAQPPKDKLEEWKLHTLFALGSHSRKILYSRLIIPRYKGGYDLLEPHSMSISLRKAWLDYWKTCEPSQFTELIEKWNNTLKEDYKKDVGPIWSWESYKKVPFWKNLADVLKEVFIYFKPKVPYKGRYWNSDDKLDSKEDIIVKIIEESYQGYTGTIPVAILDVGKETARIDSHNSCWYYPNNLEFSIPFPAEVYKVKKHQLHTIKQLGAKDNRFWREDDIDLRLTKSQRKWNQKHNFKTREYLKSIPNLTLPEVWKYTIFDHFIYFKPKVPYKGRYWNSDDKLDIALHDIWHGLYLVLETIEETTVL